MLLTRRDEQAGRRALVTGQNADRLCDGGEQQRRDLAIELEDRDSSKLDGNATLVSECDDRMSELDAGGQGGLHAFERSIDALAVTGLEGGDRSIDVRGEK